MTRPQLSVLQTFNPKDSLPNLGDHVWLIERGIVRTLTWNADGHVTTLGLWSRSGYPRARHGGIGDGGVVPRWRRGFRF